MNELCFENLNFDDLIYLSEKEKQSAIDKTIIYSTECQNRNYAGRYKPDRERNKKSQSEYGKKTCTWIRDAIKTGICSDANKK